MTDAYAEDPMLQQAARIAYQFKQNVIDILKSPGHEWLMWNAAMSVIIADKKAESDAMKASNKRKH